MFAYRTRPLRFREADYALDLELLEDFEAETARLFADRARRGLRADPLLTPMFGVIWPSARVATRWVAEHPVEGTRFLELAAGLGLPSLLAAARGASVLASDPHPHAGAFFLANVERNGLTADWAELDLQEARSLGTFDVVVVTDALFDHTMPAAVADGFAHHLAPDGVGLLVDPGRPWSEQFPAEAEARGLSVDLDVQEAGGHELFALTIRWRA